MDSKTKGAWLLAQSKSLDAVTGPGAARLETIAYAGRIGRLYNLLRREDANSSNPSINKSTVHKACQLNNIDRSTRENGLKVLKDAGRIDVGKNGDVSVIGATGTAVLEVTTQVFQEASPTQDEEAILDLSEKVAEKPISRNIAEQFIGDVYKIASRDASDLVDVCKSTAIIDEANDKSRSILFNSNTFRDGQYARKAHLVLEGLSSADQARLVEVQQKLTRAGALYEEDVLKILGKDLYKRLVGVGLFDRMEISNSHEAVGYLASPNDFQKFGRPFEEDPIDDAKALLASLTYGQTRSGYTRGNIRLPVALLNALIRGDEVGKRGVRAIGEDYHELEKRQVVQVTETGHDRYTMKLLKRDVGELALAIVQGGTASQEAVLMSGSAAKAFTGPHSNRTAVRSRNDLNDNRFITDALDRLRSGG